jgi:tRNA-dihydrouridine synthase B
LKEQASNDEFRQVFNRLEDASEQLQALEDYFVTVEKR